MLQFLACLIGGLALISCGLALFRLRPPNWQSDVELPEGDSRVLLRWSRVQRTVRFLNNSLICIVGILISTTAFVPRESLSDKKLYVWLWAVIFLCLLGCILLAMIDALGSLAGYKRALPVAAQQSFGSEELTSLAVEDLNEETEKPTDT